MSRSSTQRAQTSLKFSRKRIFFSLSGEFQFWISAATAVKEKAEAYTAASVYFTAASVSATWALWPQVTARQLWLWNLQNSEDCRDGIWRRDTLLMCLLFHFFMDLWNYWGTQLGWLLSSGKSEAHIGNSRWKRFLTGLVLQCHGLLFPVVLGFLYCQLSLLCTILFTSLEVQCLNSCHSRVHNYFKHFLSLNLLEVIFWKYRMTYDTAVVTSLQHTWLMTW